MTFIVSQKMATLKLCVTASWPAGLTDHYILTLFFNVSQKTLFPLPTTPKLVLLNISENPMP